jgi:carboxyl-terminal processing protease
MMWQLRSSIRGLLVVGLAGTACAEDPFDFGDPRSCEIAAQNAWVYGLMQDAYLWAPELPEIDPADYESPEETIAALRVDPDRWSRVADKVKTEKLFEEGQIISLGFRTRRAPDGTLTVSWVSPNSSAEAAGMARGDTVRAIGGFTIAQIDLDDRWDDVYGDDEPGVTVNVEFSPPGAASQRATLVKDWLEIETVPVHQVLPIDGRPVGYLMFNTFVDTAPERLDAVFEEFVDAEVDRVIVDLRYNGGGRVSVARQLVDLLVGDVAEGEINYAVRYGPGLDDQDVDRGISRLDRSIRAPKSVVFITSRSTVSASELVINAVRPHLETLVVGDVTGGKPVGSHQWEFCDKLAQPITFRLLNADGQGEYFDGIVPDCAADDDLTRPVGDVGEGALAHAIHLLETGECLPPPPSRDAGSGTTDGEDATVDGLQDLAPPPVHDDIEGARGFF